MTKYTKTDNMYVDKQKIRSWLRRYGIEKYTVNDDFTVDVDDSVNLLDNGLTYLPIQFGVVHGEFNIASNKLTSLKGSPTHVEGTFNCNYNELKSLQYAPRSINNNFMCANNHITDWKYFPEHVESTCMIGGNRITTHKHIIKSLKFCSSVIIEEGPAKGILYWMLIPGMNYINLPALTDNIGPIYQIFNKYLKSQDLLGCQEALIDAGYSDWAKL